MQSKPIVVVDDDESKHGRKINGVPVLGDRYDIKKIAEMKHIDEIIIALPSAPKWEIKQVVELCSKTKCKLKMLPGIYELLDGKVSIKKIINVRANINYEKYSDEEFKDKPWLLIILS